MVTFPINIPQMLAYIYQHHGSYGYERRPCVTGQNQNGDSLLHKDRAVCQTDDKTEPNCTPANGTLASIAALHRLEYDLFKCPSTLWFDPKPFGDTNTNLPTWVPPQVQAQVSDPSTRNLTGNSFCLFWCVVSWVSCLLVPSPTFPVNV